MFLILMVLASWRPALAQDPLELVHFDRPVSAPAFTLPTPSGDTGSLEDYRGRFVLLNFWATWCPPCLHEMPSMQRLYEALRDRGFVVLAVASDSAGKQVVEPFIKKLGVTFPIFLDQRSEVSNRYGARELPSTFLLDHQGNVVAAARGERDWSAPGVVDFVGKLIDSTLTK